MPEVKVQIGGRDYTLACQPGEEAQLKQAAALLDTEAETLQKANGRVPEPRMLLMSGLMLADRTTEIAKQYQSLEAEVSSLRAQLYQAQSGGAVPAVDTEALAQAQANERAALAALERATQQIEALAEKA